MKYIELEETLASAGIKLPSVSDNMYFSAARSFGDHLVYISGCGPNGVTDVNYAGKVGAEYTAAEGREAARLAAVNCLAALRNEMKPTQEIKQIVKLLVFVSSASGFTEQAQVAHGASELLNQILGEKVGKAARSAIGVAGLPFDFPVEVEMLVELE